MVKKVKKVKIRRAFAIILCILSAALPLQSSFAESRVIDSAGLFTSSEESRIEEKISKIQSGNDIDVVIWTTTSLPEGTDRQLERAADNFFENGGYGVGADRSGILLMIDMGNRYVHISTHGKMIDIFYDSVVSSTLSRITSCLKNGDYYGAASSFLNSVSDQFSRDRIVRTNRVDRETGAVTRTTTKISVLTGKEIVMAALGGIAAALILLITVFCRYKMKGGSGEDQYAASDVSLTVDEEQYTHEHTVRTRIQTETSSGGGSGGGHTSTTHSSSHGSSFGGGGSRF